MKTLLSFLLFFPLLTSTETVGADLPASLQKALQLKEVVQKANFKDIEKLWDDFQAAFSKMSESEQEAFLKSLRERLDSDKNLFRKIKTELAAQKKGSPELTTSLTKLVGIEDEKGTVLISGILSDAVALLSAPKQRMVLYQDLAALNVERNQITVLKTILVYANVLIRQDKNITRLIRNENLEQKVQLLYLTPVPELTGGAIIPAQSALACENADGTCSLCIPNAGYIFGGNFVDGQCRGIDCSAFVSHCVNARVRMSTLFLDMLWREMKLGEKGFSAAELPIRKELIEQYQLIESTRDFDAIDPDSELQPGDLITWRGILSPGGHTVLYIAGISGVPNEFVGIEANREDNKSKEGIEVNTFKLSRKGYRTTLLRRK